MIRDLLKWVAPGLATVLGGTALLLVMTSANIASDVATQSTDTLRSAGYDWAELSVDSRDVALTGTTTDQSIVDQAVLRLASLSAVRSVAPTVTLAPVARPYTLEASVEGGAVSLIGGVPDERTKQMLLSRAGIEQGGLELRSGMPDRHAWLAGAQYAIDQLKYFDQANIKVSDLTVNLSGRAKSERDFRDLLIVMRAGAPEGVTLGAVDIVPALVSPYQWNATSDGERISVEGFVPDEALIERLRTADVSGLPVATGLALGSGEPAGFAELSQKLVEQLSRLEYGSASIIDGQSSLSGAPPSAEIADDIVAQLQSSGSIVVLDPPRIADYWTSATLQPSGALVFDGYAPDEATRDALGQHKGADITWLKLGRGAPERYQSAVDFGLQALGSMNEGRFALRDNVVTLSGVARSGTDYQALLSSMASGAPQGLVLARAEILAPRAAQYGWAAVKDGAGAIMLSGMVPNPEARATLLASAGATATDTLSYASGEPNNFLGSAQTGLGLMQWLGDAKVIFDGSGWTITGTAKSAIDKGAIEADFVTRQLAANGWSMAVAEPAPTIPEISPYTWSVAKAADGTVALTGHAPTPGFQRYAAIHAGAKVSDLTNLGAGAPEGFVAAATAALDAVLSLEEGSAQFDGTTWSLSGKAASETFRESIIAALGSAAADWSIAIDAPVPAAAAPYLWLATKAADGAVTLTGSVPAEALQRFVAVRAGNAVTDETIVDPVAPAGFADDMLAAIDALGGLSEGSAGFDGSQWSIKGDLRDATGSATIDGALATAATPADAWLLALITPPPVPEAPVVAEAPVAVEPPTPEPEPVAVDPDYAFSASRSAEGAVILSGQLPADPAMRYLGVITRGDTAAVSIAAGAPEGFLANAEIGLRALIQLSEGQLDFAAGAWSLKGIAPDMAIDDAVTAATAAAPAGSDWTVAVDVPAPEPEPVAATPSVAAAPQARLAPADIAACRAPLADFSARNAILFQSGAAIITTESEPALDELATDLAACPDAVIHIEGHTDADGDEQLNLALSVARAEAVVEALVERGVVPARLYAVGYGESTPIADNETAAGKRLNRRIVVTVTDEHY